MGLFVLIPQEDIVVHSVVYNSICFCNKIKTIFDKNCQFMDNLGSRLRRLREERLLTLKKVADVLQIDQALLCRIEKGQSPTKEQVIKLAAFFQVNQQSLLAEWLSDKVAYELEGEPAALKALQLAEEKIKYNKKK